MFINQIKNVIDLTGYSKENIRRNFLGKGYRNSCYKVENGDGYAILFGYDNQNQPQTFVYKHQSRVKYRVKYETNEKDIFGNNVETKCFRNVYERKRWLDDATGIHVVEALRPEQEILLDLFHKDILDEDFNNQPMRTFYLDIETEISDSFEQPKDARNRINMITVYDSQTEKFITWSLENATIDFKEDPLDKMPKDKFEFRYFRNNETILLEDFILWWEENYPDVVTAWNGKAYDYPYIVRRIENVLSQEWAKRLSPIGEYRIKDVNHENKRAIVGAEIEVDISGIFLADDLILYRDKFGVKKALDGGYSLDNVGEAEDLGHKIHYEGTLKDLYEKDYQKFYEYNVRDVDLLKRIEDKCKLIPLARRIVSSGLCNYDTIYSSISYLIGSLLAFSRLKMEGKIFQSYLKEKRENTGYEGAFVFPPKVGRYVKGVCCLDVNSLYPNSIRTLNLSPETYVGKIINSGSAMPSDPIDLDNTDVTEFTMIPANGGSPKTITKEQLLSLCKTKCIFTRNNTLFLKHSVKQGVVSAWCSHFYDMRKKTKKSMQRLELKLSKGEISQEEIEKTEVRIENLDNIQQSMKIMLNSVYGILGTSFSPIGNVDLAQSITRNGKFCNTSTGEFVTNYLTTKFGSKEDIQKLLESQDKTAFICGGDTDSSKGSTLVYIRW